MTDRVAVLRDSVTHLREVVEPLDPEQLRAPAYPTEWSVAETLSHLGSGAVISAVRLDAFLAGTDVPDDFAQPIWDEWNAKSPDAQAGDALAADQALVDRLAALSESERAKVALSMGPMQLDFEGVVAMRINEHVAHTWDVEVALDPAATLPADAVDIVFENLGMIAGFTAKPIGGDHEVHVHTTDPERDFVIAIRGDAVTLTESAFDGDADLELAGEAFVRLVYGRLDPDHTPPVRGAADLNELRQVFPGL